METTRHPIRAQMNQLIGDMKKLAGEVRVQIHLGNMDLKKAWNELEPKLAEADRLAENATEDAYQAVRAMLKNLEHIHGQLPRQKGKDAHA
jgi:hypothetical protein